MPIKNLVHSFREALRNSALVSHTGVKTLLSDPLILAYPILASLFFAISFPIVDAFVVSVWAKLGHFSWLSGLGGTSEVPHPVRVALGIVTFSYFYTSFVTVYFTCAVSAAVTAKLEGHPTSVVHGLEMVWKKIGRISRFALLSIFYVPLAFYAQRRKLPGELPTVIGSSISVHTAQLAPAILNGKSGVGATIRDSLQTLGKAWHEGLVFKIASYLIIFGLSTLSFLPKWVEKYWFDGTSAHWAGWLASALLFATFWVTTKVFGAVFVTALYWEVKQDPRKYK